MIDNDAVVAHFTSELAGGSGIAAKRLHLALCRAGVKSVLHFGAGEAIDSTMIPAFQNPSTACFLKAATPMNGPL